MRTFSCPFSWRGFGGGGSQFLVFQVLRLLSLEVMDGLMALESFGLRAFRV